MCVYPMVVFALILVLIAVGLVVRRVVWWRNNVQLEKGYAQYMKYTELTSVINENVDEEYGQESHTGIQNRTQEVSQAAYPATSVLI